MVKAKEYDIKMAAYFDNEMSGEDEAAFMQELNNTPALRERFEDELQVRAILGSIAAKEGERNGTTAKIIAANTRKTGIILWNRRMAIAAAVIIAFVAVSVVFVMTNKPSHPLANIPAAAGSNVDSPKTAPPQPAVSDAAALYKKFYQQYANENGPVEVSLYYQQYKKGNYAAVLNAKNEDLQQMGANNNADALSQYLQLYKGLAYLAQGSAARAVKQFDSVTNSAGAKTPQYYTAQWYGALAALALGQTTRADSIGAAITAGASPYKAKATEMVRLIASKHRR